MIVSQVYPRYDQSWLVRILKIYSVASSKGVTMKTKRGKSILCAAVSLILLFSLIGGTWMKVNAADQNKTASFVIPTISIVSVVPDTSVTIRTANYPANDSFNVYMNFFGTRGVGGVKVDTISSGAGGTFEKTFTIPDSLKGLAQIAIRLESPTSGYFSYNWFHNVSGGTIPNTGGVTPGLTPTFIITGVVRDGTVTIKTASFPANDTFNVLMGNYGTRGVGGTKVDTINSGAGGALTLTFNIPDSMKGKSQIAVRLESPTSGYFSYNWFYNSTFP